MRSIIASAKHRIKKRRRKGKETAAATKRVRTLETGPPRRFTIHRLTDKNPETLVTLAIAAAAVVAPAVEAAVATAAALVALVVVVAVI